MILKSPGFLSVTFVNLMTVNRFIQLSGKKSKLGVLGRKEKERKGKKNQSESKSEKNLIPQNSLFPEKRKCQNL